MWFSDTVKRATRYSMLRNQRDNMHQIIKAIGEQEGVEAVRVFNKQGRIMSPAAPRRSATWWTCRPRLAMPAISGTDPWSACPRPSAAAYFETKPGGDGPAP
jgi:hypothetical protein